MSKLPELFANNRAWAEGIVREQPDFFQRLASQQNPKYLWIGCADSRVPANEIIGLMPGEVFVHRNVANVVVHTDLNCLSVLQYAVDVLKVEHVIVCGHYGCGGVQAAYGNASLGLIDNWLRHVKDVAEKYEADIATRPNQDMRLDRLCELNVIEQVLHVCRTTIVLDAWKHNQPLTVHGWVYRLQSGMLKEIGVSINGHQELERFLAQKTMPGATH
jgi:carbonic anhydrase